MAQEEEVTMARLVRARRIIRQLIPARPAVEPIRDRIEMEIRALRKRMKMEAAKCLTPRT